MEPWFIEIKPTNKLFQIDFREIWKYRDLLKLYIKRDIITQYKQTILGPLWYIIQPAITTVFYMLIFGHLAKIPTDGLPQPLFYLAGIVCWQYFSDCLNKTSNTFISNQDVFGKVYFPRLIIPLSIVTSNMVRFSIQFILFLSVYIIYLILGIGLAPNLYALLIPVLVIMLAGLSLGFGIIVSSMTTKYRDLSFLFAFIVQLWMFATPIIYPLSTMPQGRRWIMVLNPITSIVETFKYGMLGVGTFNWFYLLYSFTFMLLVLGFGIIIFNKVQKNFMDTV